MSLIPTGMPSMGDKVAPAFQRAVDASAAARGRRDVQGHKGADGDVAANDLKAAFRKARGESLPLVNAPVWET